MPTVPKVLYSVKIWLYKPSIHGYSKEYELKRRDKEISEAANKRTRPY